MNIPCLITCIRIIGTVLLLFTSPFTAAFYIIYTISGISDVLDGFVARKMNQTSEFGAKLDSVADMLFYAVMIFKIFPVLWSKLHIGIWYTAIGIALVRVSAYIVAAVKYKCFASLHTYLNKLTGFTVFTIPYTVHTRMFSAFCIVTCVIAALATVEELVIHIRNKEYVRNKS